MLFLSGVWMAVMDSPESVWILWCVCGQPGIFGPLVAVQRSQDDIKVAVAKHFGRRIRVPVCSDFFDEFVNDLEANLLMRFLAAFEPQLDPDFMLVAKELDGVVALYRQVVRVDHCGELQLLHTAGRLRGAGIFRALRFLV